MSEGNWEPYDRKALKPVYCKNCKKLGGFKDITADYQEITDIQFKPGGHSIKFELSDIKKELKNIKCPYCGHKLDIEGA